MLPNICMIPIFLIHKVSIYSLFSQKLAFYEEEVKNLKESKAEKLAQIEKEIEMQKKSTAGMTKKVAIEKSQMQQSNSEQYSEEVLEWQKIAKKEKSSVSMSSSVQQQSSFVTTVRTLISYR